MASRPDLGAGFYECRVLRSRVGNPTQAKCEVCKSVRPPAECRVLVGRRWRSRPSDANWRGAEPRAVAGQPRAKTTTTCCSATFATAATTCTVLTRHLTMSRRATGSARPACAPLATRRERAGIHTQLPMELLNEPASGRARQTDGEAPPVGRRVSEYFIHYLGWSSKYDEWVDRSMLRRAGPAFGTHLFDTVLASGVKFEIHAPAPPVCCRIDCGGWAAGGGRWCGCGARLLGAGGADGDRVLAGGALLVLRQGQGPRRRGAQHAGAL